MTPEDMIKEYNHSIKIYQERIKELRGQRLTGEKRRRLVIMEDALMDMQYAVGVLKRDISMGVIARRHWI